MQIKILIIEGSPSFQSFTRVMARTLESILKKNGAEVNFWSLHDRPLEFSKPEFHWDFENTPDENALELGKAIRNSDAIALASPLYHGSFSGVLKNALDCLWFDAFNNKPVSLLSHGSTDKRCAQPSEHLMTVVKTMYGYPMQTQVCTCKSEYEIVDDFPVKLVNDGIIERLERQAVELIEFAKLLSGTHS